jgi:hypothetical protein
MFQFLFKYPGPVFSKGRFVLLSAWPAWLLPVLILVALGSLALVLRWRLAEAAPGLGKWRVLVIWAMQSGLVALILVLLWQPAMTVSELNSQRNIIAVVVDDSRSMNLADINGRTREAAAMSALQGGVLSGLQQRFQTRVYRLGAGIKRVDSLNAIAPVEPATRIDTSLKQLVDETSDLPIGAILLLSDGGQNTAGLAGSEIGSDVIHALRNRRLPVHTIGFGSTQAARDVEIEDVSVAASAVANARIATTVSLTQHGYSGGKAILSVRDANKTLAEREIILEPEGRLQTEPVFSYRNSRRQKPHLFSRTVSRRRKPRQQYPHTSHLRHRHETPHPLYRR